MLFQSLSGSFAPMPSALSFTKVRSFTSILRGRPSGSQPSFNAGIALSHPLQICIRFLQTPLPPEHCDLLTSVLLFESPWGLPCFA